jgi:hypothetical protein
MEMTGKRKVSTDALETLGMIINETQKRDAIHLAVEPVIAKERLLPGQNVGVNGTTENPVGIVDPFLKQPVEVGERFWLVVYPRQIHSLRHVWTHPDFPDEIIDKKEQNIIDSIEWIKNFVREIQEKAAVYEYKPINYEDLMEGAKNYIETRKKFSIGGYVDGIPDEFWIHYIIITGEKEAYKFINSESEGNFFMCYC